MLRKSGLSDLARFGGSPATARPLHVNRPNAGDRQVFDKLVDGIWDTRWFTNAGPLVDRFEAELAAFLQVDHVVVMASGTAALDVLIRALDLAGEVILPSYTFISSPHVLMRAGLRPVFCDIEPAHWNIDPAACEAVITNQSSAILATHVWGRAADIETLQGIATRHGLALIFDTAHGFGCTHKGRRLGRFGDAEVFSFQANKAFHCGEGGAVSTNDAALAARLRRERSFGFVAFDEVAGTGTNAKLPELSAALGLTNLAAFPDHVARARAVWQRYADNLAGLPGFALQAYGGNETYNHQYVAGLIAPDTALSRDQIIDILHAEGVLARRYFYPGCHGMKPYDSLYPGLKQSLTVTEDISKRVLVLPGGAAISDDEIDLVCDLMRLIMDQAPAIATRLRSPA